VTAAPYGSWASPVTADRLVEKAVSLGQVAVDGPHVYWNEGRPSEGGRQVVVRSTPGDEPVDLLPAGFSARTTVHEYGGASFAVRDGVVWFANFDDQRVYRVDPGGQAPTPITPEPPSPRSVRFADFDVSPDGTRLAAVRERHLESGEAVNDLVLLEAGGPNVAPEVVAEGYDFYAAPRFGPTGLLAWLSWNHPNMPWDGTELWLMGRAGPAAGGSEESISQPRWGDEDLFYASDRTGFWNLYQAGRILHEEEAEYSGPDWVFGQSTFAVLPRGAPDAAHDGERPVVVAARSRNGLEELTVDFRPVATPFTSFSSIRAYGRDGIVGVMGSAREAPAVVRIELRGPRAGEVEVVRRSRPATVAAGYLSVPEPITFPTDGGLKAHALFYPPANADFEGPDGELPPLVVMSHGGPTSAAQSDLNLRIQYFTSRGLAVVDVDYGGSSGYGRAYRRRLDGQWGVVDLADCVNAARHLADKGLVDGRRMAIRGGSAGGFTTLCALTFADVFAAGASYYGVADLASLATDTHKFESRYLDRLVGPWPEAADVYRARSPIHAADRLSAPVIIFQGLDDKVVPPAQAEIMVDALRAKGLPFAYVTFEGEQHGFRKAETIVRAAEAELSFYGRILGFQPADDIEPVPISNW
jgi:dipeptidyl aminopeptidase/acylaminoacyl peptidase